MTEQTPDLLSMTQQELADFCAGLSLPAYRAGQLFRWLGQGAGYEEMSNLPLALRQSLAAQAPLRYPRIAQKFVSRLDGTVKYVYELFDGEHVESVVMRYHHGTTICISCQVGCRMGCRFCASTLGGKVRDLSAGEMLGQILVAAKDLNERIDGVVLMGIGEPLDNYENVLRFLRRCSEKEGLGIGQRHISLSSCGLVDKIDRLAEENLGITLSISLHAPTDALRSAIMPVNEKWGVDVLLEATVRYFEKTGRRISFEYTLIRGKNDTEAEARALAAVLKKHAGGKMPLHVNLIPVNPVKERGFSPGSAAQVRAFAALLEKNGITATVRRRLGADIDASCGQLRARLEERQKGYGAMPQTEQINEKGAAL